MEEALKGTTEAISLIDDPILRILISLLFFIILAITFFGYKFIKSLMSRIEAKDKEVVEAYALIYKDSKANLELVFAFERKLDEHIGKDDIIRQDIHEILKLSETIKFRLEEFTKKT